MNHIDNLEKSIGVLFKDKTILENVLIHRSYLNENRDFYLPSNEKLEFLGDSVLSLVTSMHLYKHYPQLKEGDYTEIKAAIVRTESLAYAAKQLKLGSYLYLSKGQDKEEGRKNINILADCFEALIGAIFVDISFESAYSFVLKYLFENKLDYIIKHKLYMSPKSRLQEYTQARFKLTPIYKVIQEKGPEHERIFHVATYVAGKKLGIGTGKSKKQAEEEAAKKTLEKMI
ncbi:ribonuclease III [Candidatus Roizmanbacteria bacterium]|nr:ribonuclease III [Candidatus Roizmanbacteria bacterium]